MSEKGETDHKAREIGGIIFVAFMFIGGGIGMLLNHGGAGWVLGIGFGFLAMALISPKKIEFEKVKIPLSLPRRAGGMCLIAIGIAVIVLAVGWLSFPEYFYTIIPGISVIIIGIGIATAGFFWLTNKA